MDFFLESDAVSLGKTHDSNGNIRHRGVKSSNFETFSHSHL
jgi:hypothetical protein